MTIQKKEVTESFLNLLVPILGTCKKWPHPIILVFKRMVSCTHEQMQERERMALGIWKGKWDAQRGLSESWSRKKVKRRYVLG